QAQREAYCDALADDGWYGGFWISKLHFYISGWPFYNFPYTFGYLLSLGIYRLRDQLEEFPARIRDFLIATGSQQAEEAVEAAFGQNLREPEFWNGSLDIVEQRVHQFLELSDRVASHRCAPTLRAGQSGAERATMEYVESILLGLIQGIAEFLPISSSGHLVLGEELLRHSLGASSLDLGTGGSNLTLNIALHLGTLGSIVLIYWK